MFLQTFLGLDVYGKEYHVCFKSVLQTSNHKPSSYYFVLVVACTKQNPCCDFYVEKTHGRD
jgi:hypothetical protein